MIKLNYERIFWIVFVITLLLLLRKCSNDKTDNQPSIPTPAQQLKPIIINEGLSKLAEDSIIELAYVSQQDAKNWEEKYYQSMQDYVELANNSDSVVNTLVPDTCKEFQASVKKQFQQLAANNKKTQDAHNRILSAKNNDILQKEALLANCKKDYSYLRKAFDTALDNQRKLQKIVKPSRIFSVGITGLSNYNNFDNAAVGVTFDYMNRKGTSFGVGIFNTKQVQLSWKKGFKF